jgi:hypothetical protein
VRTGQEFTKGYKMKVDNLNKFARKIAGRLRVEASEVLTDDYCAISISKIADILESRGEYSYTDNVCLADCLKKHYRKVNYLLDAYWSAL